MGPFSFFLIDNAKNVVNFATPKINIQRFIIELLSTNISILGMFIRFCPTIIFLACSFMLRFEKYVLDIHV